MARSGCEVKPALSRLSALAKQAGFAARLAANETAKVVLPQMRDLLSKRLDQPVPFTLNAPYIKFAARGKTEAVIRFRDFAGKGTPAFKYLSPLRDGGMRRLKRFERALIAKGLMPAGMMTVGGKHFVNAAGNLRPALIVQILSATGAFAETGHVANRTAKARKSKAEFFVKKDRWAGKPPGVWMRPKAKGGAAKPVVIFTKPPTYRRMLDWDGVAKALTDKEYPRQFRAALAKALRTARG